MFIAAALVVTRLLGLISGEHPLSLEVDGSVHHVTVARNGATVATLDAPPWRTVVDFGAELVPQEVTVTAFDAKGNELAHDTQLVNLPRPPAEAFIDLQKKGDRMKAVVRWQHIGGAKPQRLQVRLDGKKISKGETSLTLPRIDLTNIHVIEAEIGFPGDVVAKKEVVFGGLYTDEEPAELTGILARGDAAPRQNAEGEIPNCFAVDGTAVAARGVEKGSALLLVVRNGDTRAIARTLELPSVFSRPAALTDFDLSGVQMRLIYPVAQSYRIAPNEPVVNLFDKSSLYDGEKGLWWLLTKVSGQQGWGALRYADAVSVAGVQALVDARRRAVVVLLDGERDASRHSGVAVRRYLARIGVPLYVWSAVNVTPAMTEAWGEVRDVSTFDLLRDATADLRKDLDQQWIVWLRAKPLDAIRAAALPGCSLTPVAKP
ncbi:MAG TPA: hypothetical protein VF824_02970 [Thermoanaerobaculia bacterium]|jgi:hypothetical protein